jgi:hypothetical protein
MDTEALHFVRRGIPELPRSRRWVTVRTMDGIEQQAPVSSLYIDGPAWAEWVRVYEEQKAESMAEITCKCCGAVNYSLRDYNDPEQRAKLMERSRRLREAHNAALIEAGREPYEEVRA